MSFSRIRENTLKDGIIYTTIDGNEINVKINNYNSNYTDTSNPLTSHDYDVNHEVSFSKDVVDKEIIIENFYEDPYPTMSLNSSDLPVTNGSQSYVPGFGTVTHYTLPNENIIINVTEPGHALHPGIVVRELYEKDGVHYVNSTGIGNGFPYAAGGVLGDWVWSGDANRIGIESVHEEVTGTKMPKGFTPPPKYKPTSESIEDALSPLDDAQGVNPPGAGGGGDPLVLDMNGDGQISLTSLENGVYFDIWGEGFARQTGWVAAEDGMLALDQNGNGTIDDLSELFGSGHMVAANGNSEFQAREAT